MKGTVSKMDQAADASVLTDVELIAQLTGDRPGAEKLMTEYPSISEVGRLAVSELSRCMSRVRAARFAAALELGRRASMPRVRDVSMSTPADVFRYAKPRLAHLTREVFHVLCLDARHRLKADRRVAEGGLSACAISPRDVFEPAIREAAPAILVIHNHPSGDPTPSRDDIALTRRIREAAQHLGISLVDHVVVADGGYVSLLEAGKL